MKYLLDTGAVAAIRRLGSDRSSPAAAWLNAVPPEDLFVSAMTCAELESGIRALRKTDLRKAEALRNWYEGQVLPFFEGRILPVDMEVVRAFTALQADGQISGAAAWIAATAAARGMTIVTRSDVLVKYSLSYFL
ncbi:PIN domain-containing protein [Sutterella sp.]|uniref:PIN domain-containing protein n=1 Tax=Sutterella sp. TaxID=1981025 RepID=UPI0026DEB815|nr:PIN domain-containing protein [Sutterella sp.]MDO5532569.1 PIN domain-containing protein [Sutterella sp.]